ncbi:MAG TPA: VWA domain-containing protein [Chryseosolibacter sp.]|nr:VWA domain-containing protein [Chryseosolibacter sp.]
MKKLILESAPEYIILCLLTGIAYAAIQYYRKRDNPWSNRTNWVLFVMRAALATFLGFLLLGPIVRQIQNLFEKPVFVIVQDNSTSIMHVVDSAQRNEISSALQRSHETLQQAGYTTISHDLEGALDDEVTFTGPTSDLNEALKSISNQYEGQKIGGVILVSDGIYNAGLSPLYSSFNFPVHTIGIGDTTLRVDASLKNIAHNKLVYQGNKFPIRADVQAKNLAGQNINVTLSRKNKTVEKKTLKVNSENDLLTFEFQPLAEEQGIQKYDLRVEVISGEQNTRNNSSSVFIEVVNGKKKILLVAPSPHPDIKALRDVVQKNANYDFMLHIPGIEEQPAANLKPEAVDLAIFHQSPDSRGRTNAFFQSFVNSKASMLMILGQQSDLGVINKASLNATYESLPREFDEVTVVANPAFPNFSLSPEANSLISDYPPALVHFGKIKMPSTSSILLYQKVGSVTTDKPFLLIDVKDARKTGLVFGEGIWRWKLNEFERTENSIAFDEIFGKVIQFLSTTEDKRKFRSYPVQQEFPDTGPVVFESQVYNDLFEPVYGNKIDIDITDESGKQTEYTYVTSPGNIRYQIGGLTEGVYRYKSRAIVNDKQEEVRGEFAVVQQQLEMQNLTADFDLLRKLSANTGGEFYKAGEIKKLDNFLKQKEAKSIIHSEERFDSVINLKWVFFVLLVLVSTEWVIRKYFGSY